MQKGNNILEGQYLHIFPICIVYGQALNLCLFFLEDLGQSSLSQLPQYSTLPLSLPHSPFNLEAHLTKHFFEDSLS